MSYDRRTLVVTALALIVVIVGGMAIVAITSDASARQDAQEQSPGAADAKPSIIPRPGEGRSPTAPNERGGAEQLALFGLVLVSMAGIGVVVVRGGKSARAGRAEWAAAGRTGHDGILVAHDQLAPDADLAPARTARTAPDRA